MTSQKARAYVSSSHEDLREYRRIARDMFREMGFEDHCMEQESSASSVLDQCLDRVRSCRLFLLLVAFRYGTLVRDDRSLTELEYECARESHLDVIAFRVAEEAPWQPRWIDAYGKTGATDGGARIERFRERLMRDGIHFEDFSDEASFRNRLGAALISHQKHYLEQARQASELHPAEYSLKTALTDWMRAQEEFENQYYSLPAATGVVLPSDDPWSFDTRKPPVPELGEFSGGRFVRRVLASVTEALPLHPRFLLVGDSGAGKSWTLRHLRLEAGRRFLEDPQNRFPLLLDVSEWDAEKQTFEDLLREELWTQTAVEGYPSSHLFLLIDGLTHPSPDTSHNPAAALQEWLRRQPLTTMVIAVRECPPGLSELPVVRLSPLEEPVVRAFLSRRIGEVEATRLLRPWERRASSGLADDDVFHLLRNPFNLDLLCKAGVQESLPSTRGELIRRMLKVTCERELHGGNGSDLDYGTFLKGLGAVALQTSLVRSTGLAVDPERLREHIPERVALDDFLSLARGCRVLRRRAEGSRYEFEHRLYVEYFAAEYLRQDPEALEENLGPPRYDANRRVPGRLDPVITTLLDLDGTDEYLEWLAERDPCLAAASAASLRRLRPVSSDLLDYVASNLTALLQDSDRDARAAAMSELTTIGVPAVVPLSEIAQRPGTPAWVRRQAVQALGQLNDAKALELVVKALADKNRWVRKDAEAAIESLDEAGVGLLHSLVDIRLSPWAGEPERELLVRLGRISRAVHPALADHIAALPGIVIEVPASEPQEADETAATAETAEEPLTSPIELGRPGLAWWNRWNEEPGDLALAKEGRALLRSIPMRNAAWGFIWTAMWNSERGDTGLVESARRWLAVVPEQAGSWSYIWLALRDHFPQDCELLARGRLWLRHASPDHSGWAYVWRAQWDAAPDDELRQMAWRWLGEFGRPVDRWAMVWLTLRSHVPEPSLLDEIGRQWLELAPPASWSWGYVWPALWDAHPHDKGLEELARRWLRAAPATHGGWGYIWPALWKSRPGDAELDRLARQWLARTPSDQPCWTYIWRELQRHNPGDPALDASGRRWLSNAAPNHGGWGIVWQALWDRHPGDDQLADAGRAWLRVVPTKHHACGFVYPALLDDSPDDPELISWGWRWLRAAPPDHGSWNNIWRALWDIDCDRKELLPIGTAWLHGAGRTHLGFSFVWEAIFAHNPGESIVRLATEWLVRSMADPTWSHVWRPLVDAVADAAPPPSWVFEILEQARDRDRDWPVRWLELWQRWGDNADLEQLGREWLSGHSADAKGSTLAGDVWEALWDWRIGDERLLTMALDWISAGEQTIRRRAWRVLAESIEDSRFDEASLSWLTAQTSPGSDGLDTWMIRYLQDRGRSASLAMPWATDQNRETARQISAALPPGDRGVQQWNWAWNVLEDRICLIKPGLAWLGETLTQQEAGRSTKTSWQRWPFVWRELFDAGGDRAALVEFGRRWLRAAQSPQPGWGLVWEGTAESSGDDGWLRGLGWEWIRRDLPWRSTWPSVWRCLRKIDPASSEELEVIAQVWLRRSGPGRRGAAGVWCELWDGSSDHGSLRWWGLRFIQLPRRHLEWPRVALRMWGCPEARERLEPEILDWLAGHPRHTLADQIAALVASPVERGK